MINVAISILYTDGNVPTFNVVGGHGFNQGQSCINVQHPDGYDDNVCLEEKYPGYPTILEGYFDKESDVKVTAILEDDESALNTVSASQLSQMQ